MSALDELVETMARLRAPGGCPWDAQQTHASLVTYLIEESHELAEAIETGADDAHLVEELGDVLLQVAFHAEIARAEGRFDLEEVAARLVEKLRSRHPHVFGDVAVSGADEVVANWDALKRAEKPERESALDGIPAGLPALALAAKTMGRARRAGLALPAAPEAGPADEAALGEALLALVRAADVQGLDAERALRAATRGMAEGLRAQERAAG
ncbi:MazG family protein [Agrococcus sp. SL85]|uniref:MazG family protein n=1 Tax=Agrococcus sp. SL85 TaxID=2995141 RepID=UPI00226CC0B6|nr:MazG family protein [Agrococcus sp. SL85]WAC65313.1 MazG family protein [Agrococcus sp. SL85]